jgi:hypothetical protein
MVEALIVIPVLIVVNGALLYMLYVYDAKLVTMRRTSESAWSSAVSYCQGEQGTKNAQSIGATPDTSLSGVQAQAQQGQRIAKVASLVAPFRDLRLKAYGVRAEEQAEGNAVFVGDTLASDATVLCNEKPNAIPRADEKQTVGDFYRRFIP